VWKFDGAHLQDAHQAQRLKDYVQTLFGFESYQDLQDNFLQSCYAHWHLVQRHERRTFKEIFDPYLADPCQTTDAGSRRLGQTHPEHHLLSEDEFAFVFYAVRHSVSDAHLAALWGLSYAHPVLVRLAYTFY